MHLRFLVTTAFAIVLPTVTTAVDPEREIHEPKPWKAGVARVNITPEHLMWMSGYANRKKPAEGKLHDLWAKVLVLEDPDGRRAVLVTMDLVGIPRDLSEAVCQELQRRYKLGREAVLLNVSHTHTGPVVGNNLLAMYDLDENQLRLVSLYAQRLQKKLVARVLGDCNASGGAELIPLLGDDVPRVRMQAAISLGRLGKSLSDDDRLRALRAVYTLLIENADRDAYILHGAVMALVGLATADDLPRMRDESSAVPLGVLLALRRLHSPAIRQFLSDPDPRLVVEAARAIHDVPIPEALPDLAKLLDSGSRLGDSFFFRALNANFRLGKAENAEAVAAFAARTGARDRLRVEALRMLGAWEKPGRRDRVTGATQDLGTRDSSIASTAMRRHITEILVSPNVVRDEAVRVVGRLGLKESGPALIGLLADQHASTKTRVQAMEALDAFKDDQLPRAIRLALKDTEPRIRNAGRRALTNQRPDEAIAELRTALDKGTIIEQQLALTLLGDLPKAKADGILSDWLDRLLANQVPDEVRLELLEAAKRRHSADIKKKLEQYVASLKKGDPVAAYQETLRGGDAAAGREIFFNKTEAACLRCHKIQDQGGDVGPNLTGIGAKQTREYLLESIVDPNRQIAKGFETVVLTLQNGKVVSGVLKEENAQQIKLITPEGESMVVAKKEIEDRQTGKSAMPEEIIKHLSKTELRDLIEFLASLK